MERLRAGLNGSEWVGWSYVFHPVTPGTSGRCRGGKERPARPPPPPSRESHESAGARRRPGSPLPRGPQVSAAAASFPRSGGRRRGGLRPRGGGRARGEGPATWANLPQGNEVSSRLLGGAGGGRIRPRLTQAGRGISPVRAAAARPSSSSPGRRAGSRPAPCPPPRPGPLSEPRPCPHGPGPCVQESPASGRDRGRGGCHPMGSGRAARRGGSRGRRRARCAHLTRRAWAPSAPRPPRLPGIPAAGPACGRPRAADRAREDTGRRARVPCLRAPGSPPRRLRRYTTAAAPALRPGPGASRGPAAPCAGSGGPAGTLRPRAWDPGRLACSPSPVALRVAGARCLGTGGAEGAGVTSGPPVAGKGAS